MHIYVIVAEADATLTDKQRALLGQFGTVVHIIHHGRLGDLHELKTNTEDKILALSPTACEWTLDIKEIDAIPHVRAVITQSTSFDWILPDELGKRNILACNCPGFSSESVAEYAMAMAIDVSRRLPLIIKNGWKPDTAIGSTLLAGKTLGVIGMGRIGQAMARKGKGLGMDVIYWSKKTRVPDYTFAELPELFQRADVLMPALSVNEETQKLITQAHIDSLKKSAVIVGIGRVNRLLPLEHILKKVANNELGGLALEGEGAKNFTEYQGNVWSLPAIAWITDDSTKKLVEIWVSTIIAAAKGIPQHVVNQP